VAKCPLAAGLRQYHRESLYAELKCSPRSLSVGQEGTKEREGKEEGIERRKCMGGKVVGREVDEQEFSQVL